MSYLELKPLVAVSYTNLFTKDLYINPCLYMKTRIYIQILGEKILTTSGYGNQIYFQAIY
jgi:hypothetical protein